MRNEVKMDPPYVPELDEDGANHPGQLGRDGKHVVLRLSRQVNAEDLPHDTGIHGGNHLPILKDCPPRDLQTPTDGGQDDCQALDAVFPVGRADTSNGFHDHLQSIMFL